MQVRFNISGLKVGIEAESSPGALNHRQNTSKWMVVMAIGYHS